MSKGFEFIFYRVYDSVFGNPKLEKISIYTFDFNEDNYFSKNFQRTLISAIQSGNKILIVKKEI